MAFSQLGKYGADKRKWAILSTLDNQSDQGPFFSFLDSRRELDGLILIGAQDDSFSPSVSCHHYTSTEAFLADHDMSPLQGAVILVKGASRHKLGRVVQRLTAQTSHTTLETNLSAIAHNLNAYRSQLQEGTGIMAVIKAQAYGSGSVQLARFLQSEKVDYLGVALVDEAVALRKNGCQLPILVFNVQLEQLDRLWTYRLEPEVYGFELLEALMAEAQDQEAVLPIHLKVDTGMHRLGFVTRELPQVSELMKSADQLKVASIFSHMAASESETHDAFSEEQIRNYDEMYDTLSTQLGYAPVRHLLNSAGALRFAHAHHDMVRIGLGLYGLSDTDLLRDELIRAHTLYAVVLQIKTLRPGQSTGYGRAGVVSEERDLAVLSIGYADGFMRAAGGGRHVAYIQGQACPTIGHVCMDVTMVLLPSDHEVRVGDRAIIFGPDHPVELLAEACGTISYEVLSRLSPRVKRSFVND